MSLQLFQSISENPEQFRKNVVGKLKLKLPSNISETAADNMEKGIYNYTVKEAKSKKIIRSWAKEDFVLIYMDKLRSIYLNIGRKELQDGLASGEILPQDIAFMTHQEMHPEHWRPLIEKKMKRDESKYNTNIQASTDMFTCKRCKSKRCTYYELQTRSADEPATIFVSCLDCGKHWKN